MNWQSDAPERHPVGFVAPCLPTLADALPTGREWAYEVKHDGYRFVCRRSDDRVRAFTRRGYDWTERVPLIVEAMRALQVLSVTIDGEAVACGANGITDFDMLHAELARYGSRRVFLYAFDILELDGRDLRTAQWEERRKLLRSVLRKAGAGIRLSDHLEGTNGDRVFHHACSMGLEGIVAKRRDRHYHSGKSTDWLKVRNPSAPAAARVIEGRSP
jgi:bifunctional non-homologous end joining protein LigD